MAKFNQMFYACYLWPWLDLLWQVLQMMSYYGINGQMGTAVWQLDLYAAGDSGVHFIVCFMLVVNYMTEMKI